MSKILIFTSSPQRDKYVDERLASQLTAMGNEVFLHDLPLKAREAVLNLEPDVVVLPPPRNIFSIDMATNLGRWGVGVVIKHIEPSCDKNDIANMDDYWRHAILFPRPRTIRLEIMWGNDEAEYVRKMCRCQYPIISVGSFVTDTYKSRDFNERFCNREEFIRKHSFDINKKTILISSPWGLVGLVPDHISKTLTQLSKDFKGREAWLQMVAELHAAMGNEWNILATLHPLLAKSGYERLTRLGIEIDASTTAVELLANSDILIHSGSTMALEMHWLNKPSFQFGDVNSIEISDKNWWWQNNSHISRVSPFFLNGAEIAEAIKNTEAESNANPDAIAELETGRYGSFDGKATERAAIAINQIKGKFNGKVWPLPIGNNDTCLAVKEPVTLFFPITCQICNGLMWIVKEKWFDEIISQICGLAGKIHIPPMFQCPHCGSVCARDFATLKPEKVKRDTKWTEQINP